MRIATWNMGNRPHPIVASGLDRLSSHGVDAMGLQEAGDRRRMLNDWCARHGWRVYYGEDDTPGAPSVPILWNPDTVVPVAFGTREVTDPIKVGKPGAGPSTMKAKVWNRVRFQDEPTLINGHIVPSVYLPARRRIAEQQIEALAEMAAKRKGRAVVAVGDFNMRPTDKLVRPLRDIGMVQRTQLPTHGRRLIDHVWTQECRGATAVLTMPSDHKAVVLSLV